MYTLASGVCTTGAALRGGQVHPWHLFTPRFQLHGREGERHAVCNPGSKLRDSRPLVTVAELALPRFVRWGRAKAVVVGVQAHPAVAVRWHTLGRYIYTARIWAPLGGLHTTDQLFLRFSREL